MLIEVMPVMKKYLFCLRIVRCDDVDLITLSSFNEDDEEDDVNIFLNGMW